MKYLAIPFSLIVVLILANIIAWSGFFWSYHAFTREDPILTLRFEEKGKQSYLAYIESPKSVLGEYLLNGDQWRIDARFVKMKYWANFLGMESRYAIDRLQGRYINVEDENSLPNIAHQLKGEGISHLTVFGWSPFVDIEYGSSTYQLVDTSKRFTIYKTPTGLIVRSENIASEVKEGWLNRLWR